MIATPQLPVSPCTLSSTQNSGIERNHSRPESRPPAESRGGGLELPLQLRSHVERLAELRRGAGRDRLLRAGVRQKVLIPGYTQRKAIGRAARRHDGADEVVLQGGEP